MMARSFLYVPAVRPELFDKAVSGEADAVILDLEDAVPAPDKPRAREQLAAWLDAHPHAPAGSEVWVRVNPDQLDQDVAAAARPGVTGLVVAAAEPETIERAAALLDDVEPTSGLAPGATQLVGLVETARGLLGLADMAAAPRLRAFGLGEVDLLADLRIERRASTTTTIDGLRCRLVVHSAAAGLAPPLAPTSTAFRDLAGFRESSDHLFALGFRSRTAIHPAQVPVIHAALRPTDDELVEARQVLAAFDAADGGITQDAEGHMVDAATVRRAREIVARAPDG